MRPERMARLVARWVRFYTRNLPGSIAQRRIDEIDADLHDQVAHERAQGTDERRIALTILSRMLRGLAADVAWRGRHAKTRTGYGRAIATALAPLLPLAALQIAGAMDWGPADFAFAGALLAGTGLLLALAVRNRQNLTYLAAATAIGVAAIVLGESDDAPGLVLFGCLLIVGTVALAYRTAQRSG